MTKEVKKATAREREKALKADATNAEKITS
jgi:hypothetical protein